MLFTAKRDKTFENMFYCQTLVIFNSYAVYDIPYFSGTVQLI